MPTYKFICNNCNHEIIEKISINTFRKRKNEIINCPICNDGVLYYKMPMIKAKIDKAANEILAEVQEELHKTIDKVKSGDQKTIEDIYGTEINKVKFGNK